MFDVISSGFDRARQALTGRVEFTEENLKKVLVSVEESLLEGDVEYSIAQEFVKNVAEKLIGQEAKLTAGKSGQRMRVRPADHFIKASHEELIKLMGPPESGIQFATGRPTVIMMVGLQGSGKTTSAAKLANFLQIKKKRYPSLVAGDTYRPAAIDQLKILGDRIKIPVFTQAGMTPVQLGPWALEQARLTGSDTIIFDTAGRVSIDETLMRELEQIKALIKPDYILFVCDAMMGQDAVTTAKAFHDRLNVSGFVMTKLDGDARGGAALSIKKITGRPIKFLGMGEGVDRLEEFRPEGLASRILGQGDVVGLMQDFERVVDKDHEIDAERALRGQFNYKDFYSQLSMIQKMGSVKDLLAKLPLPGMVPKDAAIDDSELTKIKSMIDSMTAEERIKPHLLNQSRIKRIALGSGRKESDVNALVKQFNQLKMMMGTLGKNMGGLARMAQGFSGGSPGMFGGGGMGGFNPFAGAMGGSGDFRKNIDKEKLRKQKKLARQAKKKNRKK